MTLTELSYYSRKFAPFGLLFFLVLLILYYLIRVLLLTLVPVKPTILYINPVFGNIKKPLIKDVGPSSNLSFSIDTIEGKPVTASESAKVFFLPSANARFGYREKIYLIAKTLGFDTESVKHRLEGEEAIFKDARQTLQIDITNFNFTYEYNFENEPQIFKDAVEPLKKEAEDKTRDFLRDVGRYPEELAQGKTNTIFISYNPEAKQMKLLDTNKDANLAEVDLYRPDQEQYPVVSPKYFNSQNYVMLVFYKEGFKIIKAQIKFYEKSNAQIGVYPIKTGDLAWEALKTGNGVIIQNEANSQKIVIKKMFLGYLDPDVYQEYLQPVYVFLGENNFVSYVPAITDNYFTE
ncbi:hypothetical protein A3A46_02530 [Candidatus Roizmanbacteria bacterium RIFCSPLOWO2_01_FULL_37_13]|uniref:Uncharacterized protein n=1 Tax=Candidatus Roizmanbacteria bacterium RIFCSPHIGHO2_02_FULL_38_11 TaxID=1802039 RepID=A0A1F7H4R6_9BACT|nr:MAG: hypothetical protein A3C25_04095 [Candidatus Roizmanbacteria bacterium RIFCSPHIGHO2_02_FULL_38_11]OGK33433.1 MAG: hypothetical protein A3F58_02070 [Candidatus Roizmanbacteria bacterium RIFCSPHIGHO2_12_FULL_37_9b]OGK41449.1 MAG: hypothetical protein A3A46_02530 [Candidatus Roizmanbacteria bacterium RIFCSPLOWO2_01_FULL_37_13]